MKNNATSATQICEFCDAVIPDNHVGDCECRGASAHTRGPWRATIAHCEAVYGLRQHHAVIADDAGTMVCDCCPSDETEANARLIAAAPELLEHLECIVEVAHTVSANWECRDLGHAVRSLESIATAADVAIARATGRTA